MRLARGLTGSGAAPQLFAITGDGARMLAVPAGPDPLLDVLRSATAWADLRPATDSPVPLAELQLLAPIERPGKVVAIGLNYHDHTAETGLDAPSEPLTFAKYPSSITGPADDIVVPTELTTQVDWEAELAFVIGRRCGPDRRGTMADIAGYTVANDVSARDLQFGDKQWTRGKSLDTFCPLGPVVVSPDEFGDPSGHRIWATVNGSVMQDGTTSDLIFDVPTLLDSITAGVTLEPGDVVLTGTPPGVGGFRTPPVFLADGDVVRVGVDGIGELANPVRWKSSTVQRGIS